VASHLIDSTEMYVRTVWELEEEGITPIRARLSERLNLSAPSVSETVTRLEHEGLLRLTEDRTLELTDRGRELAVSVMRKHRLAECLLVDVIGLEWEHVHAEACRWEHVISDDVEQKLIELLGRPDRCPHGNPIPGLADKGPEVMTLLDAATRYGKVRIARISEQLQSDVDEMKVLARHEIHPDRVVEVELREDGVAVGSADNPVVLASPVAQLVYVEPAGDGATTPSGPAREGSSV
jgi:DtxR family transcriptional regulator, Mn-dependent transcriptional regulator